MRSGRQDLSGFDANERPQDEQLERHLATLLEPGERVLWDGRPSAKLPQRNKAQVPFAILFMAAGIGFAALGWHMTGGEGPRGVEGYLFPAIGLVFGAIGAIGALASGFSNLIYRRMLFVLTDRRAIRIFDSGTMRHDCLWAADIGGILVEDHGDDTATIYLVLEDQARSDTKPSDFAFPSIRDHHRLAQRLEKMVGKGTATQINS